MLDSKLKFGDLACGEHFICWPVPGDNSGHGGYLCAQRLFVKIGELTASNGDAVLKPLADNRTHITGFFHNAAIAGVMRRRSVRAVAVPVPVLVRDATGGSESRASSTEISCTVVTTVPTPPVRRGMPGCMSWNVACDLAEWLKFHSQSSTILAMSGLTCEDAPGGRRESGAQITMKSTSTTNWRPIASWRADRDSGTRRRRPITFAYCRGLTVLPYLKLQLGYMLASGALVLVVDRLCGLSARLAQRPRLRALAALIALGVPIFAWVAGVKIVDDIHSTYQFIGIAFGFYAAAIWLPLLALVRMARARKPASIWPRDRFSGRCISRSAPVSRAAC